MDAQQVADAFIVVDDQDRRSHDRCLVLVARLERATY
jgi:hypothetical protein